MTFPPVPEVPVLAPPGSVRRSVQLLRAHRDSAEHPHPQYLETVLAGDAVREVRRWGTLRGQTVLDVGGGTEPLASAFREAGAGYRTTELSGRNRTLPVESGTVDIAYCGDVASAATDHVAPEKVADEMLRVTRPGGLVVISFTPAASPWFTTRPQALIPRPTTGRGAAKSDFGRTDFGRSAQSCSAARMMRWMKVAAAANRLGIVAVVPRYHPRATSWVVNVPGIREVVAGSAVLVARSR